MKILDIPFDEETYSPLAYDYAPFLRHAKNYGALFKQGHIGRAIEFKGVQYAKVNMTDIMPNNSPYTVLFWLKAKPFHPYSLPTGLEFATAYSNNNTKHVSLMQYPEIWTHYAVAFDNNIIKAYINGILVHTELVTDGYPVEWAFLQNGSAAGFDYELPMVFGDNIANFGLGLVDQLLVYNEILSDEAVNDTFVQDQNRRAFYYINEKPFDNDFDVYVSDSSGLIDALSLKDSIKVDWPDEHGLLVDLDSRRFQERVITLKCFIRCNGFVDFSMKVNDFLREFTQPGSQRLRVDIDDYKQLVYEVYMPSGTDIEKKWREGEFFGTFTLSLKEAEPVKRVLRFDTQAGSTNTVVINMQGGYHPYNIYWGDGSSTKDIFAQQAQIIQHTYQDVEKKHYIIVSGDIEGLVNFSHNGIMIWNQL